MKHLLSLLAALWIGAAAAQAQSPADIQAVIRDQIEAMRADDFTSAFDHASPGIRRMFGTADNFGVMVREGYPMVWKPRELRFLDLRDTAGTPVQRLMVRDADGRVFVLDYYMLRTEQGWKIDGVTIVPAPGGTA